MVHRTHTHMQMIILLCFNIVQYDLKCNTLHMVNCHIREKDVAMQTKRHCAAHYLQTRDKENKR